MFWWEGQNNHCQPLPADKRITIAGAGYRLTPYQTTTGTADYFCMFSWEKETIDGGTIAKASAPAYSFRWEEELDVSASPITFHTGVLRTVTSPDRQYLAVSTSSADFQGCGRVWHASPANVMVTHTLTQDRDLNEDDTPDLIPPQLRKYLRRFVMARAYGRTGEGYRADLAEFYQQWFQAGVRLFTKLSDLTHRARVWRRDDTSMRSGRMPRVRMPSTFEQTWF